MRCPSCGHKEAQAGQVCDNCGSYVPKSAAARAAAYDPDSELDDEELYEAPETQSKRLMRLVFNPFEFKALPEEEDLLKFLLMTVGFGTLIGVPGLALGFWLAAAEEQAWSTGRSPGTSYPSYIKVFMLPAFYGLLMAFSGLFRSLLVLWPWLNSQTSMLAWFARMVIGLVMLIATGSLGIYLFYLGMGALLGARQ